MMNKTDEIIFWMKFFDFAVVFLACVVIAWTRHGEPDKTEQTYKLLGMPFVKYKLDGAYIYQAQKDDPLSEVQKEMLRRLIQADCKLTFRSVSAFGISRATWARMRYILLWDLGHAVEDRGRLVLRSSAFDYLGIEEFS